MMLKRQKYDNLEPNVVFQDYFSTFALTKDAIGMKNRLNIIVLLAILFVSCSPHDKGNAVDTRDATFLQQLTQIDSLMWQQPDSALMLLLHCGDGVNIVPTTEQDRHYYQLLLAELLYKNDSAQVNRTELCQAVAYFDSLVRQTPPLQRGAGGFNTTSNRYDNLFFLAARAHYINGVGYYEQDSIVKACAEYLKALEMMENRFEEKSLVGEKARFMALTYTRLTGLFSDLYLHEQAIYFGKKALEYYQKYNAPPWHLAWILDEIGSHYDMMDNYDSASFYYRKGLGILPDTNSLAYRGLTERLAFLAYEMKKEPCFTLNTLNQLYNLLVKSDSEKEYLSRCLTIGEVLFHELQFDSAFVYLNEVYNYSESIDSRKQAAEWLVEICKAQGREAVAIEYAAFLVPFANLNENQSFLKSQLTELCHEFEQKKQEAVHQNKLKETLRKGGFIILGLVLAFSVGLSVYILINKRRIAAERQAHKMQQAALSGRLKRSNEKLRDVSKQLEQTLAKNSLFETESPDNYTAFLNDPISLYIVKLVHEGQFKSKMDYMIYKESALSKEQILVLRDAAEKYLKHFVFSIRKQFINLTDSDMDYCYLFLLGLSEADVSALMQRAYTTVCDRSRKISRIIGTNDSLYQALHNMLLER